MEKKYSINFINRAGPHASPTGKLLWYKGYAKVDEDRNQIVIGRYSNMIKGEHRGDIEYIGGIYTDNPKKSKTIRGFCTRRNLHCDLE